MGKLMAFVAELPEEVPVREFLQMVRDFDLAHPGCKFTLLADEPGMSLAEIQLELDQISPGFKFWTVKKMGDA